MRPTGLEPEPIAGHAPQTCAYADSATAARSNTRDYTQWSVFVKGKNKGDSFVNDATACKAFPEKNTRSYLRWLCLLILCISAMLLSGPLHDAQAESPREAGLFIAGSMNFLPETADLDSLKAFHDPEHPGLFMLDTITADASDSRIINSMGIHPDSLDLLSRAGFRYAGIVSDHFRDGQGPGRYLTRRALSRCGLTPIGDGYYTVWETQGKRLGLTGVRYQDHVLYPLLIEEQVRELYRMGCDAIICVLGWTERTSREEIQKTAELAVLAGADLVVGTGSGENPGLWALNGTPVIWETGQLLHAEGEENHSPCFLWDIFFRFGPSGIDSVNIAPGAMTWVEDANRFTAVPDQTETEAWGILQENSNIRIEQMMHFPDNGRKNP